MVSENKVPSVGHSTDNGLKTGPEPTEPGPGPDDGGAFDWMGRAKTHPPQPTVPASDPAVSLRPTAAPPGDAFSAAPADSHAQDEGDDGASPAGPHWPTTSGKDEPR